MDGVDICVHVSAAVVTALHVYVYVVVGLLGAMVYGSIGFRIVQAICRRFAR